MKINIILFFLVHLFFSCKSVKKNNQQMNTVYLKDFNLFRLEGSPIIEKNKGKEFVGVVYSNGLPVEITFNKTKRKVKFVFQDSFKFNNRIVYKYTTTNLLGGNQGKIRIYSTHYIKNKYELYVNKSDTIVIKCFDEIDAADSNYWYSINFYKRNIDGSVTSKLLFSDDINRNQSHDQVLNYSKWMSYFPSTLSKEYDFRYSSFPPN